MSDFSGARFFQTPLEIVFPEAKFAATALVSPFGVSRLLLPISLKNASARAQLLLEGFAADILLVKQFTEAGAFHSARFAGLSQEQLGYLRQRVEERGIAPAWVRRFPRLTVAQLRDAAISHPSFCLFSWQGKDLKPLVANFTVDGLRLTLLGELPGLRVGTVLTISVYTSTGAGISGLDAEVRNFSLHEGEGGHTVMELGLRFLESRSTANESYRALIRDCVISLKALKERNP